MSKITDFFDKLNKNASQYLGGSNDTSNPSGTNNIQNAVGTPKATNTSSGPTGVNTQSYNLAGTNNIANSVGTPSPATSQGKTFVPQTDFNTARKATAQASTNLKTNTELANVLSGMADDSNRTAQNVLQKAAGAFDFVKNSVKEMWDNGKKEANNDIFNKFVTSKLDEARENKISYDIEKRDKDFSSITEADYAKMFDESGNVIDYQPKVKELETQLEGYNNLLQSSDLDDKQRLTVENQKKKAEEELNETKSLFDKTRALNETFQLQQAAGKGDTELYNSLLEQFSHKEDNVWERFGNAAGHLVTETVNEIPQAIDQIVLTGRTNVASDYVDELEALHEAGEISDEQYLEGLKEWNDSIQRYRDQYNDSFSQKMQVSINQLSTNTHYGASQIEDFVLNAGESTAQFVLHYAIGKAVSGLVFGDNAILEAGRAALLEGMGEEAVKNATRDQLFTAGSRILGGEIATTTMSLASSTAKFNQLIAEGYSPEVAMQNALFTGLTSYAVEKVGMDRFIDMLGTNVSVNSIGQIIAMNLKSGLSEGAEETVEGLIDPLIDYYTLGKDYEVNGNELLMSFLLGGASGVLMGVSANIGNVINGQIELNRVNQLLKANANVRSEIIANTGKLLVNNRWQYNALREEVNTLSNYRNSMTPDQQAVADELIRLGNETLQEYEAKTALMGVTLPEDEVTVPTPEENNQMMYTTLESDFNQDVETQKQLDALQEKIRDDIADVTINEIANLGAIQQSLYDNGYNIDAVLFNSLDEQRQNDALVALDFAKIKGMNIGVVDDTDLKNVILENSAKLQKFAQTHTQEEVNAKLQEIVDNTNGVRVGDSIYINANQDPILETLVHELTHGTEDSDLYDALKDVISQQDTDWNGTVENKAKIYDDVQDFKTKEARLDNAEREVIAQTVAENLGNEEFINDLIRYDYSAASRLWQNINALGNSSKVEQIKNAFERAFTSSERNNLTSDKSSLDNSVDENRRTENTRALRTVQDIDPLFKDIRNYDVDGENIPGEREYNERFERTFNGYFSGETREASEQSAVSGTYGDSATGLDYGKVGDNTFYRNETIDRIFDDFSKYGKYWNYAITNMNPRQFLYLTLQGYDTDIGGDLFIDYFSKQIRALDEADVQRSYTGIYSGDGPIKLVIGKDNNGNLRVINHEGRHRSWAMVNDGINQTPVVLSFAKGISPEDINNARIFVETDTTVGNGYDLFEDRSTSLGDITPITEGNKEEIKSLYGPENEAKYYFSYGGPKGLINLLRNGTEEDIKLYNEAMRLREEAEKMRSEGKTEDEIHKATGWFIPDYESNKAKDRFEFYDDGSVNKLLEYVKSSKGLASGYKNYNTIKSQPTLGDILGEDSLFLKMYPSLKNMNFVVNNRAGQVGGAQLNNQYIRINKKTSAGNIRSDADLVDSIAHEIQHQIQEDEGFEYDYGNRAYYKKPGEIESFEVGYKQANVNSRNRDIIGDIINKENNDDFKQLQSSSQEIVSREGWDDTSRYLDENLQNRLSKVLRNELESRNYSDGNADGLLKDTGDFKILKDVDGQTFHDIFEIARAHLPFGELVDLHPVDTNEDWTGYNDTTNYLSSDGLSGFSITKDGDLISVFNLNRTKKGFLRAIAPFIRENAKTLDCYVVDKAFSGSGTDLQQLYHDVFGFDTREVVDYDYAYDHDGIGKRYGDPKIAYMYNPNLVSNAQTESEVTPQQAEDNILMVGDDEVNITKVTDPKKIAKENSVAKILDEKPKPASHRDVLNRAKQLFEREIIDHLYAVEELAREYKKPSIIAKADFALTAPNIASQTLTNKRYKLRTNQVIGESLYDIMGDLSSEQKHTLAEFLYHWRNIDHLTLAERVGEENKKGVFGESIGVGESQQRINEILESDPWVQERADRLYEYLRLDRQELIDSGVISKEFAERLEKLYPHYVPIQRNVEGSSGVDPLDPNKSLKRFKGSTIDILPLEDTLIKHTNNVYRTALNNSTHNEIMDTVGGFENMEQEDILEALDNGFNPLGIDAKGAKRLFAYKNGQRFSMPISDELYDSLSPAKNSFGLPNLNGIRTINEFRRNLITGWNPMFMFTNGIKDVQDAMFNTKYPTKFLAKYAEAWAQIANKGEFYQTYMANGGGQNSYIKELSDPALKSKNPVAKAWNKLININEAVEMAPRLAEFIATLEDGKTIEEAMYNAAEVTTNFKRGGDTAKYLNRNGFAFLNASIQGFNKQVRNLRDAKDGGVKGMLSYMAKAVIMGGVPLFLLNGLMWKDDKDYEELSDYVKANYYCVAKYGDGKFIRAPKGRVAAFLQTVAQNTAETVQGQKKMWEALIDDYTSFMDNVAPNNPVENFILTPLIDAANNTTWYGGDLVPSRLQDVPDSEQYDETTDELSKAIGRLSKKVSDATGMDFLELSPYKINYVLDQYSGAIGDIALPAMTQETAVATNNPLLKGPATAFLDKFTTDSVLKNKNVTNFYSLRDEVNKLANSAYATDEQKLSSKYLYSVSSEMGKLYAQIHSIQADSSLSNKEKYNQTRELKKQINDLAKEALANYDQINISGDYANIGGVQYYKTEDGWKKPSSNQIEKIAGLKDEDKDGYFQTFGEITSIRENIKSQTPEGQKANYTQATVDAISNSKMSYSGKNTLFDSYYDSKFTNHVNSMDLSDEQKYNLKVANKMAEGTKDANGKTIANSKAEATAEAYRKLGLLEDVLKYIKDNDINPSDMGLSKSVYNKLIGSSGTSYSSSYKKTMGGSSSGSKSNSLSKVGKFSSSSKKISTPKQTKLARQTNTPSTNKSSFANAYAGVFNRNSSKPSTGGSTVTCPNCKNQVTPYNGRCPICGASL